MMTIPTMKESFVEKLNMLGSSPKHRAVFYMALASALHFSGYEVARSGTLAILTSRRSGFISASTVSFATGCVSPFSVLLLLAHTRTLDRSGPRSSLFTSTFIFALLLFSGGIFLVWIDDYVEDYPIYHRLSQMISSLIFVAENGFVQLLYSQHWSFLSSVQSKEESAVWFAPIAGLGSIFTTLAAMVVSPLVTLLGLPHLLVVASLFLVCGAFCSDKAYQIAEQNDFSPEGAKESSHGSSSEPRLSLLTRARALFRRVPILGALCVEVLICQCLSSLLSFLFMMCYKETLQDDEERARYTGKCYAWINFVSGVLQFGVLPVIMKRVDTRVVWVFMPTVMFIASVWLSLAAEQSLFVATVCFCLMKIIEYTFRGLLTEMVYVSLDYESRFLGKEIIGLTVNRFGKSLMALTTAGFGLSLDLDYVRSALALVALLWLVATYRLVRLVDISEVKSKTE